ncbi:MAG: histidinol-phosphate transaminase [Pseudomonadota bacterium]
MSRYWSELVKTLTPYVPGEQPQQAGLVKLNTNESPYPPSPAVMAAVAETSNDSLRRYPDPQCVELRSVFAQQHGLSLDQVFVGNGSDEVLALTFLALLKHDRPLYFPDITYSFYHVWAQLCQIEYRTVPLAKDFTVPSTAFPADSGGVILPNPNAPTGIFLPLPQVRTLLGRCRGAVVVIDEAYVDFGGESATSLIDEFDNLLVIQTLSKSRSLAGLRVGFAAGQPHLIEALDRVKNSFNSYPVDAIAQRAATAALRDDVYYQGCIERIVSARTVLETQLRELGFAVLPSAANFLMVTHPERSAEALFDHLRQHNVLVRYFDKPRIDGYLRISVGTPDECEAVIAALRLLS